MIKKTIRISDLNNRIEILNKSITISDDGQALETWSVAGNAPVWCHVKTKIPSYSIDGNLKTNEKLYHVFIKQNDALKITSKLRLQIKENTYEYMRVEGFSDLEFGDDIIKIKAIQSPNEEVTVS